MEVSRNEDELVRREGLRGTGDAEAAQVAGPDWDRAAAVLRSLVLVPCSESQSQ